MQTLLKALAVFISAKKHYLSTAVSQPFPLLELSLSVAASLALEYFTLQGYQSNSTGKMWSALGAPAPGRTEICWSQSRGDHQADQRMEHLS